MVFRRPDPRTSHDFHDLNADVASLSNGTPQGGTVLERSARQRAGGGQNAARARDILICCLMHRVCEPSFKLKSLELIAALQLCKRLFAYET